MKRLFVLVPIFAISSCYAEYTVPFKTQEKILRELASAIDRSDSVLFTRLLKRYPLDTFTQEQRQRLGAIARKTITLRKRGTGSLFSSGKDTVQAAIAAALTVWGGKIVYDSIIHDQESALNRVVKGILGSLIAHIAYERFADNLNGAEAHNRLDRARAIAVRLESLTSDR